MCRICEAALGDQPRTELLCHHIFHTNCVLTSITNDALHFTLQCVTCRVHVFPEEEEDENESVGSTDSGFTTVLNQYDTNTRFRKDVKYHSYLCKSMSKPKQEFLKLLRQKKRELAEPYALMKSRYEGLFHVKKDEIVQSEQYKAYRLADTKKMRSYRTLQNRYNIGRSDLAALSRKPGLRSLKAPDRWRYRSRPSSMIARALRIHLPSYY